MGFSDSCAQKLWCGWNLQAGSPEKLLSGYEPKILREDGTDSNHQCRLALFGACSPPDPATEVQSSILEEGTLLAKHSRDAKVMGVHDDRLGIMT